MAKMMMVGTGFLIDQAEMLNDIGKWGSEGEGSRERGAGEGGREQGEMILVTYYSLLNY